VRIIALGVTQGLTEFLPVSSSGHLYFLKRLLGIQGDYFSFFVFIHIATLAAIILFLSKSIKLLLNKRLLAHILLITLITGVMGLGIKFYLEKAFGNRYLLTFCFLVNSAILLGVKPASGTKTYKDITLKDALVIGLMQGFSPLPGISRSGITIAGFLKRGFSRKESFVLAFLAAVPVMLAAFLVEFKGMAQSSISLGEMMPGFIAAFFSGFLALAIVKRTLINHKFNNFAYYCLFIALLNLVIC